jgi:hypothetical protein
MLNRLFPIIHERVVQGMPLDALRHRWAAMNPPTRQDDAVAGQDYLGSEALDPALADRFGFVITVPAWAQLTEADQAAVITSQDTQPDDAARRAVQEAIALIERELPLVLEYAGSAITDVVREVIRHAATLGVPLSGRRAAMLYRNIAAVHAARLAAQPAADIVESSWIAVSASIPQRAQGIAVDDTRLMVAHDAAWKLARLSAGDPRRALATEPDPTRRAIRAAAMPHLSLQERSAYVADALAHLPAGGRHALAHWLVEQGLAAGLMTAVADQCGELYALVASKQDVATKLSSSSQAYKAWRSIMSAIEEEDADGEPLANLLTGLFAKGQLVRPIDTDAVLASWKEIRALLAERPALAAADAAPAVARARRARKRPHAAGAQQ